MSRKKRVCIYVIAVFTIFIHWMIGIELPWMKWSEVKWRRVIRQFQYVPFLTPHDISCIQPKLSYHPNVALISTTSRVYREAHLQWKFTCSLPSVSKMNRSCPRRLYLHLQQQQFVVVFCTGCLCKHFHSPSIPSFFSLSLSPCRPWHRLLAPCSCWAHSFPACHCALTALSLSQQSPKQPAHFKKKCVCWWPIKTSRWPGLDSLCQNGRTQVREIYIFLL